MTAVPCYNSSIVLTTATAVSALTAAAVQTFWFCSFYIPGSEERKVSSRRSCRSLTRSCWSGLAVSASLAPRMVVSLSRTGLTATALAAPSKARPARGARSAASGLILRPATASGMSSLRWILLEPPE